MQALHDDGKCFPQFLGRGMRRFDFDGFAGVVGTPGGEGRSAGQN